MTAIDIIGYCAAIGTTVSFLPQAIRVVKTKETKGISLSMYIIFVIGVAFWLIYGLMLNIMPMIIANAITIFLSGIVLYYKATEKRRS